MTPLFLVALKSGFYPELPDCARNAAKCAAEHSGCKVFCISSYVEPGWLSIQPKDQKKIDEVVKQFRDRLGVVPVEAYRILRWFVIRNMARSMEFPIITIDWDIMVFGSALDHFKSCGVDGADYGAVFDREFSKTFSAPLILMHRDVLDGFVDHVSNELKEFTPWFCDEKGQFPGGGDMCAWERFRKKNALKAVSINHEVNGKLFDGNIVLDRDLYEHDGIFGKKIVKRGTPHFVRKDGTLVKAVGVHCFMAWKNRTSELL